MPGEYDTLLFANHTAWDELMEYYAQPERVNEISTTLGIGKKQAEPNQPPVSLMVALVVVANLWVLVWALRRIWRSR